MEKQKMEAKHQQNLDDATASMFKDKQEKNRVKQQQPIGHSQQFQWNEPQIQPQQYPYQQQAIYPPNYQEYYRNNYANQFGSKDFQGQHYQNNPYPHHYPNNPYHPYQQNDPYHPHHQYHHPVQNYLPEEWRCNRGRGQGRGNHGPCQGFQNKGSGSRHGHGHHHGYGHGGKHGWRNNEFVKNEQNAGRNKQACWKQEKYHQHRSKHHESKHRKHSKSSSSNSSQASRSSSSQSDDHFKSKPTYIEKNTQNSLVKQLNSMSIQEKSNDQAKLYAFFEEKHVKLQQREKIQKLLFEKSKDVQNIDLILDLIKVLEVKDITRHFSYIKIMKVIVKKQFDEGDIVLNLTKKVYQMEKKKKADKKYENLNEKENVVFYDLEMLQNLNTYLTIFFIDGNNIFNTHKVFRKYFQSSHIQDKIQAQIRLRWLLGHSFEKNQVILFFDQNYEGVEYEKIKNYTIKQSENEIFSKIQVIYGAGKKADDRILERLEQMQKNSIQNGVDQHLQIVLVSADRQLCYKCKKICVIAKTSGRFFIKYCKKQIKRRYETRPEMRGIIKKIIRY